MVVVGLECSVLPVEVGVAESSSRFFSFYLTSVFLPVNQGKIILVKELSEVREKLRSFEFDDVYGGTT
jgi:hypothetical protein